MVEIVREVHIRNLRAFNTERVAEVTFTANTPVLTAIGYTEDPHCGSRR